MRRISEPPAALRFIVPLVRSMMPRTASSCGLSSSVFGSSSEATKVLTDYAVRALRFLTGAGAE